MRAGWLSQRSGNAATATNAAVVTAFAPAVVTGLLLGAAVSWVCYRQQRARLTDIDPVTYSCSAYSSNGTITLVKQGDDDGTPLLYAAPGHHFSDQQQGSSGSLPV